MRLLTAKIDRLRRESDDLTIAMANPGVVLQDGKSVDRVHPYQPELLKARHRRPGGAAMSGLQGRVILPALGAAPK
jgi:hypothetical protein